MKLNDGRNRDEILAEVESVRSDMDSTLSAIERKLTPGQLVDQGIEYLRSSGANEFLSNLGTSVKQNPLPVTLVGVCLAWLMASGRSASAPARAQPTGTSFSRATDEAWSGAREHAHSARQTLSDAAQAERERFDEARHSASGTVSGSAQAAREALFRVSGSVSGTAQPARDALSRGADVAQRQVDRARGGYEWMLREQPLALGAIAVAIGALLAAAAPSTRTGDEWMGEASDRLTEQAKEAGRAQLERASEALKGMSSSSTGTSSAAAAMSSSNTGTGAGADRPHGEKLQAAVEEASSVSPAAVERDQSKERWRSGRRLGGS